MDNRGNSINSQQMSYEQYQEQIRLQQEQERKRAQEALKSAGLDKGSQQLNQLLTHFHQINEELMRAENQLQSQMDAQRRQIHAIMQRIQEGEQQVKAVIGSMSASNQQQSSSSPVNASPYMQ